MYISGQSISQTARHGNPREHGEVPSPQDTTASPEACGAQKIGSPSCDGFADLRSGWEMRVVQGFAELLRVRTPALQNLAGRETRPSELVFFFLEEHVEGGERTVAAGDVLLHLHLLGVAEFFVRVDLLFQHTQLIADHDNLV